MIGIYFLFNYNYYRALHGRQNLIYNDILILKKLQNYYSNKNQLQSIAKFVFTFKYIIESPQYAK